MNYKNKKLEELNKKIDSLDKNKSENKSKQKETGAGFGFKISTEIIAALAVGVGIARWHDVQPGESAKRAGRPRPDSGCVRGNPPGA